MIEYALNWKRKWTKRLWPLIVIAPMFIFLSLTIRQICIFASVKRWPLLAFLIHCRRNAIMNEKLLNIPFKIQKVSTNCERVIDSFFRSFIRSFVPSFLRSLLPSLHYFIRSSPSFSLFTPKSLNIVLPNLICFSLKC